MPDDYKTKRQTSDYLKKKYQKNNKRYSNLFVSLYRKQVTDMLFRRKKTHNTMVHTIFKQRDSK